MKTSENRMRVARHTAAVLVLSSVAGAQSFNVDLGDASAMGVPASDYGAAAEQPGAWNGIPITTPTSSLHDLNGQVSSVIFTNASNFGVSWDHAGTLDGDGALMDDLGDPGNSGQFRFDGLQPGGYQVWTYAWAPDSPAGQSIVIVTGANEPGVTVGGAWTGSLQEGVTHAVHHVGVTDGSLLIDVVRASGSSFASVNGFQLIYSGQIIDYCSGSGTAPCPCGNQAPIGVRGGCQHGAGAWAELSYVGTTLVAADDLSFYVAGAPVHSVGLVVQGAQPMQWGFKDGLLCVGTPTERIEVLQLDFLGGAATSVSIGGRGQVSPGDRRYYQFWYLDPLSPCGTGMNTSNALQVDWL